MTDDNGHVDVSTADEWLLTNGIGGYAMGAAPGDDRGANRRRYHGLLVAAASPPVGRIVALHSVIEQVLVSGRSFDLTTHGFEQQPAGSPPLLHPDGWRHLTGFEIHLPHTARWRYRANGAELERALHVMPGTNAARLEWRLSGQVDDSPNVQLQGRALTPLRDFHALSCEGESHPSLEQVNDRVMLVTRHGLTLRLELSHGVWRVDPQWWRNFHYVEDASRGQECREDIWSPGRFEAPLRPGEELVLDVELVQPHHVHTSNRRTVKTLKGEGSSPSAVPSHSPWRRLVNAAGQFVVQRRMASSDDSACWSASVIAGYPWFADWGRDTMISLPGLMLCTGRSDVAESSLLTFARHIRNGLIPNRFDDYSDGSIGGAHYNTVDASLWFIHAVHALFDHDPNVASRGELLGACGAIIHAYRQGTDYGIRMDSDGLITAGSPDTQLTWMDARRDGITFTPRHGKAVEINALWHHGLHCVATMTNDPGKSRELRSLAEGVAHAVQDQFWNESRGCCYDVLSPADDGSGSWMADEAVRPNQIFAVSLAAPGASRPLLPPDQQRSILDVVRQRLLTPFGLRTLEPGHRSYRGRFEGDMFQRDASYHQGTVWPWLIGPYCEAVLRFGGWSAAVQLEAAAAIEPLLGQLDSGCFGQIAEVYDGDSPHRPSGCPAQAWSVAELLRIMSILKSQEN